jgi:hypothetical protein
MQAKNSGTSIPDTLQNLASVMSVGLSVRMLKSPGFDAYSLALGLPWLEASCLKNSKTRLGFAVSVLLLIEALMPCFSRTRKPP